MKSLTCQTVTSPLEVGTSTLMGAFSDRTSLMLSSSTSLRLSFYPQKFITTSQKFLVSRYLGSGAPNSISQYLVAYASQKMTLIRKTTFSRTLYSLSRISSLCKCKMSKIPQKRQSNLRRAAGKTRKSNETTPPLLYIIYISLFN